MCLQVMEEARARADHEQLTLSSSWGAAVFVFVSWDALLLLLVAWSFRCFAFQSQSCAFLFETCMPHSPLRWRLVFSRD